MSSTDETHEPAFVVPVIGQEHFKKMSRTQPCGCIVECMVDDHLVGIVSIKEVRKLWMCDLHKAHTSDDYVKADERIMALYKLIEDLKGNVKVVAHSGDVHTEHEVVGFELEQGERLVIRTRAIE